MKDLPAGIYEMCVVCQGAAEATVAYSLETFDCPACNGVGLILRSCPAS